MTVTGIVEMDKKRKKIYIDEEYVFFLYNSEVRRYHLAEDSEISEELYEEIDREVVSKRAKARALYILKASQKTRRQLLDKLLNGGYSQKHAEQAVSYAESYGYIDDLYYARYFLETSCSGRSRRDIEGRLYQRGISKEIIAQVLMEQNLDEKPAVLAALRKKSMTPEKIRNLTYEQKNKLFSHLLRKGFSIESINNVLKATE